MQESLLDAFRAIDQFRHRSEGSFRNWLARIVENNVRDHARRGGALKRGGGKVRVFRDLYESSSAGPELPGRDASPSQVARTHESLSVSP